MDNLKDAYDLADEICERYEAELWSLIKETHKDDMSLIKMAHKLLEAQEWEENPLQR